MLRYVTVTNHLNESLTFDLFNPYISGFVVKKIEGLGPGKATINQTEVSTNDGSLYNSARLPARNIVLKLGFLWKDSIEDVRHLSYKYFPIKKQVKLRFDTDNRSAEITGYVESNEPNIFSKSEDAEISVICPDPYFYSAGEAGLNKTSFSDVEPWFEFPFCNDSLMENLLEMSCLTLHEEKSVEYYGDAECGVTITIHCVGDVGSIQIYNTQTRETMRIDNDKIKTLTGSGLGAGDDIEINTVKGNKYIHLIRSGTITNILNCLDKNADWFQLARGDNLFTYVCDSGSINAQFTIENRNMYEGV